MNNTASVFHVDALTARSNAAQKPQPKVNYCYKLFRVKRGSDNGVTTVSVDPGRHSCREPART